ncbi:MAG TPA: TetR/AcrR family transcriptional regulator [Solirubrobacteraceae bacterium]|nr:TetR/AcrR family transcriptional regulator [Solirubrobacteraceae bacterium]
MYTNRDNSVRERLLAGAAICLQEKGYAETTARDISAASGANLRSIGYHFGSTRGLLLAAISLNFRRWLEPLIAIAADQQQPAAERLAAGIARFTDALADNAPIVRAWLEAIVLAGHDEELRRTLADNQSEFRRALASTLAEAGSEQAEQRAAAIVSVCDGLIVRFMLHGESARVDEVARSAAAALQTRSDT